MSSQLANELDLRGDEWRFQLFIAGHTARAATALAILRRLCEGRLGGRYRIEVIDLLEQPARALEDRIIATPTLVRTEPKPSRRVVGDLSAIDRVVACLELPPPC